MSKSSRHNAGVQWAGHVGNLLWLFTLRLRFGVVRPRHDATDLLKASPAHNVGAGTGGLGVVYLLTQLCELKSNMQKR